MQELMDFIAKKNSHLKFDYRSEYGKDPENCTEIACKIKKMLTTYGINSKIIRFSNSGQMIFPSIFGGRVCLAYHDACLDDDNKVYDPIISYPISLPSYCMRVLANIFPLKKLKLLKELDGRKERI